VTFLSPLFLVVLPLALLPALLHFWGRGRSRIFPFSHVALLQEAVRDWMSWERIRRWALLAARIGLLTALILFWSRPVLHRGGGALSASGQRAVLLLVDASYSLGATREGRTAFASVLARGRDILDNTRAGDRAGLIVYSDRVESELPITEDVARVRRELAAARLTFRPTDVAPAVGLARQWMRKESGAKSAVILSDLAAHGWRNVVSSTAPRGGIGWVLCEAGTAGDNAALVGADAVLDPASDRLRGRLSVAAWGAPARPERPWSLFVNGRSLARGRVPVLGGVAAAEFLSAPVAGRGAAAEVEARLDPDALPADDPLYWMAARPSAPSFLIVNGAPNLSPVSDEAYYLRPVLEAWARDGARFQSVLPSELAEADLSPWNALVFLNVGPLPERARRNVEGYVRGGGGLWTTVGDRWEESGRLAVLPSGSGGFRDVDEGVISGGRENDPLPALCSPEWDWKSARVKRLLAWTPGGDARVLLQTRESRLPVFLLGSAGAGRVAVLTTSVDRDWTNLPAKPIFPVLCREALSHIGRLDAPPEETPRVVGEPLEWKRRGAGTGKIRRPDGSEDVSTERDGRWRYEQTDLPGFYRLLDAVGGPATIAVNVDRSKGEGDLSLVSRDHAARALGGTGMTWVGPEENVGRALEGRPLAPILARLILAFFALETFLLWRWRKS